MKANKQDALSLLKEDHKKVQKLFKEFEKAEDAATRQELAQTACNELNIHAQVEEEIFYPAVREALGEIDLVEEAKVEHQAAKQLITTLQTMQAGEEQYKATFTVLGEYVNHHVKEEEDEMFPKVKKADLDLDALGEQIMLRKQELRGEVGLGLSS